MCEFPSWLERDGAVIFLRDKDVECFEEARGNAKIKWEDYVGHHGIAKIFGGEGNKGESFPCPAEVRDAINAGEMDKIMRLGASVHFRVNSIGNINGLYERFYANGKLWKNGNTQTYTVSSMTSQNTSTIPSLLIRMGEVRK